MTQGWRSALPGLALLVSLAETGPALADDREAQAREHFQRAQGHFLVGAYAEAAADYQAAYDLVPRAGLLFNIGLCRENLGDLPAAIELYRRFLAATPAGAATVEGARTAEARARIESLQARIAEGERARAGPPEGRSHPAALPRTPAVDLAPQGEASPPPSLVPGLCFLGGALAAAGAGLYYELEARDLRRDLDADLRTGAPPVDSGDPRFDAGRSAQRRAILAWGLAGAAGAAGALLAGRALLVRRAAGRASLRTELAPAHAVVELQVAW